MLGISDNFRILEREEVPALAAELANAWQDPAIPRRQWISVVRGEMQRMQQGNWLPHYKLLVQALRDTELHQFRPTLLDVGASSGFYSEIISRGGFNCVYTGSDYSEEYKKLAVELYPDIDFRIADATALPFEHSSFDIVLSGCCMIHIFDYEKVIAESARVARKFVVMNRTPILLDRPTTFYEKKAYGVRTLEIHFNEAELLDLFAKHRLQIVTANDVFMEAETKYGHRTYLLRKI